MILDYIRPQFPACDWNEIYSEIEGSIPPNTPEAFGKALNLYIFVGSDHARDMPICRSDTKFLR